MKKLLALFLVMVSVFSFSACKNNENADSNEGQGDSTMSGINSNVTKTETAEGSEFHFEDYFSTVLPENISAEDNSINSDAGLFTFEKDGIILFDIEYSSTGTSEEEIVQKATEIATTGNASAVEPIQIDDITFYGVNRPDYAMVRYFGYVGGSDVSISVYCDVEDHAFQSFIEHTVFEQK